MYEIKTEHVHEGFNSNKEMFDFSNYSRFDFSNYSTKSKYYNDLNRLVIGKIKDEAAGVGIKEFVGLKRKMYSFQVDNSEHENANASIEMLLEQ